MTAIKIFTVAGKPAPQGSKSLGKSGGLYESSKRLKPWRSAVKAAALEAGVTPSDGVVEVFVRFSFKRPKSHYGAGRNAAKLKASAPHDHTQTPDIDKLLRAVLDALTGVAYRDDRQVVGVNAFKCWADHDGAEIDLILEEPE